MITIHIYRSKFYTFELADLILREVKSGTYKGFTKADHIEILSSGIKRIDTPNVKVGQKYFYLLWFEYIYDNEL